MKKPLLLLAIFVAAYSHLSAQTVASIKANMSASEQTDYAKSIQLLETSDVLSQANNGKIATLFLVPNIGFEGLDGSIVQSLFVEKKQTSITQFFAKYTSATLVNEENMRSALQSPNSIIHVANIAGEALSFSTNGEWLMITSSQGREANIIHQFMVGNLKVCLLSSMY